MSAIGAERMREYGIYSNMKQRCTNERNKNYHNYGGRGISVCQRWLESFDNFYADMGAMPSGKYSIERVDVNGNYEPSNCEWIPLAMQGKNKRNNRYFEFNGERLLMSDWAVRLGITRERLRQRLEKYPPEVALSRGNCSTGRGEVTRRIDGTAKGHGGGRLRKVQQLKMIPVSLPEPKPSISRLSHSERRIRRHAMAAEVVGGDTPETVAKRYGVCLVTVMNAIKENTVTLNT